VAGWGLGVVHVVVEEVGVAGGGVVVWLLLGLWVLLVLLELGVVMRLERFVVLVL
jgi:hypothetical protein